MNSPETCTTLLTLLAYRAAEMPDRVAFDFDGADCTYAELWQGITRAGAHLVGIGLAPGDRVITVLPNSVEFFFAFYGIQKAGGIAVPLFPGFGPGRILDFARLCGAAAIIVPSTTPSAQVAQFRALAADNNLKLVLVSDASLADSDIHFPQVTATDIAFFQYTSGSTGAPKAVQISHGNLLTNIRQMIAGMQITDADVFVSWLPVYHDMGLILKTMVPFYLGLELHLLATGLRDVTVWLSAIEKHRATFTAAPDFAYRLCTRRVTNPQDYDLSSLRVALNAAEPVRAKTIEDFENAFSLRHVMVAAYGLAEATVGVSMWPPNTPAKTDAHGNVSVGRPFPDVKVSIIKDDAPAPCGIVGEIAIASTALPRGYFQNPDANTALFWRPDHIRSGDLGYIDADGDLFVVGRKKNIIIQSGRNLNPQEIEGVVDRDPDIRFSIAVGVDRNRLEGEQVFVFAEIRDAKEKSKADFEGIIIRIVHAINVDLGMRPGRVFLVKPKSIPMTYNGKLQHARMKELFKSGDMDKSIIYPEI